LAVLHSASENLIDGIVKTPEQAKKYGHVMKREITRLIDMTEQTLTFAGIQSGKQRYDKQPTDVQALITACLQRNDEFLHGEGCTVEVQIEGGLPTIHVDSRAFGSVFDNLLSNAVKYSTNSREILIKASLVGTEIVFTVQDFGRGISAKEQRNIFEPFYRTNEVVDAQIHGNGLGLSIVQHIVKQHGGYVSVESDVGKGSIFRIHLPSLPSA
jgi:signal transduction histidine kinase